MQFLGATIIAAVIFFVLSFTSEMVFGGPNATALGSVVLAALKATIFAILFHYVHNWFARVFRWYRTDDPDAPHTFDRNPALDEARDSRSRI